MSRCDAALGGLLRHQEEIEAAIASLILNETRVDDATWWRVINLVVSALDKHPLMDPLVHDSKCDCWWICCLVVERRKSCLKLSDLLRDDLVSHLLANSISVDNDLGRIVSAIVFGKTLDGTIDAFIEVLLDKLLEFLLNEESAEVLCLLFVNRSTETNHGILTSMTDINSDDHDSLLIEYRRELGSYVISSDLGVDLLHDVGSV